MLLLNYEFPPLGGGAGIASAALAQRLASRGVIVDVVTSRPAGARDSERIAGISCTTAASESHALSRVELASRHASGGLPWRGQLSLLGAAGRATTAPRAELRHCPHLTSRFPRARSSPRCRSERLRSSSRFAARTFPDTMSATRCSCSRIACCGRSRAGSGSAPRGWCRCATRSGMLARETSPSLEYTVIGNGVDLDLFRPRACAACARGIAGAMPCRRRDSSSARDSRICCARGASFRAADTRWRSRARGRERCTARARDGARARS